MRWRKLGKLFDPTEHTLPNGCVEFAQSPQALVFENFVRIYFSTRARDPLNNKYLSHVAYVDVAKDFKKILKVSSRPVIEPGKLGCYDEHGIFPLNVVRAGDQIFGYIGGWSRRVSVSVETSIGMAISDDDGETFTRTGDGPVLSSSLAEPCLVGDPFVAAFANAFHMWYIFGTGWKELAAGQPPDRMYKIGHAISNDGRTWRKEEEGRQIVADRLGEDESQALPSVVFFEGLYRMFFCYRESSDFRTNAARGYRIGYARSRDLRNWTRADDEAGIAPSGSGWDSEMQCYPQVFQCDDDLYLLYNGNEFGRFGFGLAILEKDG